MPRGEHWRAKADSSNLRATIGSPTHDTDPNGPSMHPAAPLVYEEDPRMFKLAERNRPREVPFVLSARHSADRIERLKAGP